MQQTIRTGLAFCLGFLLVSSSCVVVLATPLGTDFTYQGKLDLSGSPVSGTADFQFKLFGAVSGGSQIGATLPANNVTVSEGTFTVTLDFGSSAFDLGDERWLEVAVRSPAGSGSFITLAPRQEITASPFTLKTRGLDGHSLDAADGSPADALSIDAAGNVGIGTTTPSSLLHVKGNAPSLVLQDTATAANQAGYVAFWNNTPAETANMGFGTTGSTQFSIYNSRSGGDVAIYPGSGGSVKLSPANQAFTVAANGGIGIGVSNPAVSVQVRAQNPVMVLQDSDSPTQQSGYVGYWDSNGTETAWCGFGTPGSPHFTVRNARAGGNVVLTPGAGGVVQVPVIEITGADLAEKFPTTDEVEPGMLVAIKDDNSGNLCLARGAYNHRVAGAVLGNLPGHGDAPAIALTGRCYVWCDASSGAIAAGDLLTTSDTPGHAMRAADRERAAGAIVGKAMTGLSSGRGLILVLVNLQ